MSEQRRIENLKALEKRYPGIEKIIEEKKEILLKEENLKIDFEQAQNEEQILKVKKEERSLYLAGKRSPIEHAKNQISLLGKIVPNAPVFIVGMGNIHYIDELLKATDESVIVLLYEPLFSVFYSQLGQIDIEKLFGTRTIALVVGGINDDGLKPLVSSMLRGDKVPLMKSFALPNYEELCREKLMEFYQMIKAAMERYRINISTKVFFNAVMADNFFYNVNYVRKGYTAGQLDSVLPKNIPAIVVAAGPSLNKNIRELKKAKNKAFIIACDTAIKPLLKNGIVPDMYAMLDGKKPLELIAIEEARQIPLITLVTGNKKILEYHTGKKFFIDEQYAYVYEMFSMNQKVIAGIRVGGSVATLAFSLVCYLGFDTVIMVGQDLAYTGNKSHADGTFKEKIEETDTGKYLMVQGNYEDMVPTLKNLNDYRLWFEDFIQYWNTIRQVRFVNATEGGAKIEGTELLTLKEAIENICQEEVDIDKCFRELQPVFNEEEQKKILEFFHNTPRECQKMITMARNGKKTYKKLKKLCLNKNVDKKAYLKLLKQIKRNRKAIEMNVTYQILEETMARAEQIIRTSQYFNYGTIEEEGKEIARQGILYMELLEEYSEIIKKLTEETVAKAV